MSHENEPPEPAAPAATLRLLRGLGTDFDPRIKQLAERLMAPDAASWVTSVGLPVPGEGPLEQLVREALRRAALATAGDANAMVGIDESVLEEVWALLLENVPGAVADVPAAMAAIHDERDAPAPSASEHLAPQFVGGYELLGVLGEGASGTVFRGKHSDNGLLAAVKVLRAASQDSAVVTRFRLEAKLVAQLQHPAIVAVRDSGVERHAGLATPYIVYELVEGRTFREALRGASTDAVLAAFTGACEAIEYAHRRGILHRDIKSGNVLVDAAGGAHVLDFGIARPDADLDRQMTRTGEVVGTPSSMSPEQAAAGKVDARSDIYSLGALLFEALTGEMPHRLEGMSGAQSVVVVASTPARSLACVCPSASTDLVAVVDTALAFAADDRYPTVAALLEDVRRVRAGQPVSVSRPSAWHVLRMFARRNKRLAGTALGIVFVSVVTAASLFVAWRKSAEAAARNLQAMRLVVQAAGPMVEASPTNGEQHENLVALLEQAILAAAGGNQAADSDSFEVLASLHELAGDLALRGDRLAACRTYREASAALFEQAMARGGSCSLDHARSLVKLGDLDLGKDPAIAKRYFERAHVVFAAEADSAEARIAALDELGWSYERLAGLAWSTGFHADAFALATKRLAFVEDLVQRQPDGARQYHLASALAHLWAYTSGRPLESGIDGEGRLGLARRASEAAQAAVTQHPSRRPYQELASKVNTFFGRECLAGGDVAAARAAFERAVGFAEGLAGQDPGSVHALSLAVLAHHDLIVCLVKLGDLLTAEREATRASELCERMILLGDVDGFAPGRSASFRSLAADLASQRRKQEGPSGR